ncbi:universal stress protein [Pajaroellobacter abortibovis]|uniref:Universal stress protein n=1 Tax=Pajaroellobacter abortibovis TaxID=1882918 RepID=A0A1L6MXK8_9BACT|nr:universal stress protein [Pajaroellobacter abortibovis]APS00219.1 hypothetical protein BCY86_05640 [Pajaroellobacter abortibovis]
MFPLKTILVATDFSEISDRALTYAAELAEKFNARIVLLHAYEIPVFSFPDGAVVATVDIISKLTNSANNALQKSAQQIAQKGIAIEALLREGPPAEEVNRAVAEVEADLIVIGTHGRRGIARALLGSVAEKIIHISSRPVLVIHEAKQTPKTHLTPSTKI